MKNLTVIALRRSEITENDRQTYPEIDYSVALTVGYMATVPRYILRNFSEYTLGVYTKEHHPSFSEEQLTVAALNTLAGWLHDKTHFYLMLCIEPWLISVIKREIEAIEFDGRINSTFSDEVEAEMIPSIERKVVTAQSPGSDDIFFYMDITI